MSRVKSRTSPTHADIEAAIDCVRRHNGRTNADDIMRHVPALNYMIWDVYNRLPDIASRLHHIVPKQDRERIINAQLKFGSGLPSVEAARDTVRIYTLYTPEGVRKRNCHAKDFAAVRRS